MKIQTEGAAVKPATPKTELPPSTQLRKAVFGGSLKIIRPSIKQNLACCMAVLGVFWSVACPAAAPTYTLTDLGILPGYIESYAVAVNNAGQVAGNLFDSNGVDHAFIYSNGTMTVLSVASGYVSARAVSMNNAGQIVGSMDDGGGGFNAFSYFNGTMVALVHGPFPPPEGSWANDVNDSGLVVGNGGFPSPNAWIFPDTDLGIVSGYTSSEAFAVNNSGQIVLGETNGFGGQELFLYPNQDLGISVAGSGAGGTRPCTINNSGQIIGSNPYNGGDTGHPFLYSNGSVTDLGPVLGNAATLYDINNSGQIVGTTLGGFNPAFVYYINGTNYLLRNLSISGGTGWVFYDARGINDSGQIVGFGYNNNSNDRRPRAFLLTPTGGPPPSPVKADFNGDGKADILWQNNLNGQRIIWFMNGTVHNGGVLFAIVGDVNWDIVGSNDFNGDHNSDIIWQNNVTGQRLIWYMNGATHTGGESFGYVPDSNWNIVGSGDFNADGHPDIIWQNKVSGQCLIWFMNGAIHTGGVSFGSVPDTNWKIVASGDFNGDGSPDIVWQNNSTGQRLIWYMQGTTHTGGVTFAFVTDTNWDIVGAADFNGDGQTDIIWQHRVTGQRLLWLMNGVIHTSSVNLGNVSTDWSIRNY